MKSNIFKALELIDKYNLNEAEKTLMRSLSISLDYFDSLIKEKNILYDDISVDMILNEIIKYKEAKL